MKTNFNIDFTKTLKPVAIIYSAVIILGIVLSIIFGVRLDINFIPNIILTHYRLKSMNFL